MLCYTEIRTGKEDLKTRDGKGTNQLCPRLDDDQSTKLYSRANKIRACTGTIVLVFSSRPSALLVGRERQTTAHHPQMLASALCRWYNYFRWIKQTDIQLWGIANSMTWNKVSGNDPKIFDTCFPFNRIKRYSQEENPNYWSAVRERARTRNLEISTRLNAMVMIA